MANFREYSAKLASMSGMRRVTSTMKMVAASHLHRAQTELRLPKPFVEQLRDLSRLMRLEEFSKHRLCLPPPGRNPRVLLLVMCSDRGLCGAFNSTVIRKVREWFKTQTETRNAAVEAVYAGHKGYAALWREISPCMKALDMSAHPHIGETSPISTFAMKGFMEKRYDEVWLAGNHFVNTLTHETTVRRLLPYDLSKLEKIEESRQAVSFLIEPLDNRLLEALLRLWLHYSVYYAQLNRAASEQASRVMAMENATINLRRMEKDLILLRNRARQAAITNELTEIVSGAESLG
jgi:F-type H+-transporting ATPase subunit gamma